MHRGNAQNLLCFYTETSERGQLENDEGKHGAQNWLLVPLCIIICCIVSALPCGCAERGI